MTGGASLVPDGNALVMRPVLGLSERYIPVSDTLFRRELDVTPSRVFTTDEDGRAVLLGDGYYGVRTARWRVEAVRGAVLLSLATLATVPLALVTWLVRLFLLRRRELHERFAPGFWSIKLTLSLLPMAVLAVFGIAMLPMREWGVMNTWTRLTFVGSWAVPLLSVAQRYAKNPAHYRSRHSTAGQSLLPRHSGWHPRLGGRRRWPGG